jgi:hypothetical protein
VLQLSWGIFGAQITLPLPMYHSGIAGSYEEHFQELLLNDNLDYRTLCQMIPK